MKKSNLKKYKNFRSARNFVHSLNLTSREAWLNYCKSGSKPNDIPATPYLVYKNAGWISWGDWLGTGYIACQKRIFWPFAKARKFARALKLKGVNEWMILSKESRLPENIPSQPAKIYKEKGWVSWGDWLGTGNIAAQKRKFLSFKKARHFVRSLKLKSQLQWRKYCRTNRRPSNIPSSPDRVYKKQGWVSWGDWLGTGNIATQNKKFIKSRN